MAEIRGKGGNGNCLIQQINYCMEGNSEESQTNDCMKVEEKSILRGENLTIYHIKGEHGYHVHTHARK